MASIFYRGKPPGGWWTQFYHPRSGEPCRFSLATGDHYGAQILLRRVELEVELRRPELQLQTVPAPAQKGIIPSQVTEPVVEAKPRATIAHLLTLYWQVIREGNVLEHQANKLSIVRHFFGGTLVEEITGVTCRSKPKGYFKGQFADEITAQVLRDFIGSRSLEPKTKCHYREYFHNLFEVALSDGPIPTTNVHSPNPRSAKRTKRKCTAFKTGTAWRFLNRCSL